MNNFPVTLTEPAESKAANLLERSGRYDLKLRIQVQAGGCSGLITRIYFDDQEYETDIIEEFNDFTAVVDKASAPFLSGSTLDYQDTLEKQGFMLDNPNAEGTCACGDSFH